MVLISCIITSYNNEQFLQEAVSSVIRQEMKVDEILIADDCSQDNSRELISTLANEYSQIKPIFREHNLGVAANRDLAVKEARGKLVTTLDGDDFFFPHKISREFSAMEKNNCAIAYSNIQRVNSSSEIIKINQEKRNNTLSRFSHLKQPEKLKWLACRLGAIPRDMLLTKELYLKIGGANHRLSTYEDWDLKIRLANAEEKWAYSGVDGTAYRQTDHSLSKMDSLAHINAQLKVLLLNQNLLTEAIGYWSFLKSMVRVPTRKAYSISRKLFQSLS